MSLKEELEDMVDLLGVSVFGVTLANNLENAPEGHRPSDIMHDAESVIVMGLKMLDAQLELQSDSGGYFTIASREKMMKGHITFISQDLDRFGYQISRFLERKGYKAYHQMASEGGVDGRDLTGLFSLKHAGAEAGIGVLGRNSLLLTPRYGPRVRLTGIITNAKLEPDASLNENYCKTCDRFCMSACPAGALKEPSDDSPYLIDKFACGNSLATRVDCRGCLIKCPVGSEILR
ncbi:MAG: hypothetical protein R6U17_05350 [Thermoplasmata archaeon]